MTTHYIERLENEIATYWRNANSTGERGIAIQNSATEIPEGETDDAEFRELLNSYRQPINPADDPELGSAEDNPPEHEEPQARRQEEIQNELRKWGYL